MTDKRQPGRTTIFVLGAFALLLQLTVMMLLATDRMAVGMAVPMLAVVVVSGLTAVSMNQRQPD